ELLAAVITDWYADRGTGRGGPMLAEHAGDTDLLNAAARALPQADGTLRGPAVPVAGREFPQGDEVITPTQAGPTLLAASGHPRHDLRAYLTRRAHLAEDPPAETWLPVLTDLRDPLDRLADHLTHSEPEPLATDHEPAAVAAHHLRTGHTLADLRLLHTAPSADSGLLRRAEHAADIAIAAAAPHHPPRA